MRQSSILTCSNEVEQHADLQPANMWSTHIIPHPLPVPHGCSSLDPSLSPPLILPLNIHKFLHSHSVLLRHLKFYPIPEFSPYPLRSFLLPMRYVLVTHDDIVPISYKVSGLISSKSHSSRSCNGPSISVPGVLVFVTLSYLKFIRVCVSAHLIYHLFCSWSVFCAE